jgi:hypothetical protein
MFTIGRGTTGRPNVMHALAPGTTDHTLCGRWLEGSRAYMNKPIQEVLCYRCAAKLPTGKVIAIDRGRKHA